MGNAGHIDDPVLPVCLSIDQTLWTMRKSFINKELNGKNNCNSIQSSGSK